MLLLHHRRDRDAARALLPPGRFVEVYMKVVSRHFCHPVMFE